jgi:hypothetical protein
MQSEHVFTGGSSCSVGQGSKVFSYESEPETPHSSIEDTMSSNQKSTCTMTEVLLEQPFDEVTPEPSNYMVAEVQDFINPDVTGRITDFMTAQSGDELPTHYRSYTELLYDFNNDSMLNGSATIDGSIHNHDDIDPWISPDPALGLDDEFCFDKDIHDDDAALVSYY